MNIYDQVHELNVEALKVGLEDEFDEACVGIITLKGRKPLLCYSVEKLVDCLVNEGMEEEEVREFVEFNILGAWLGEGTPVFVAIDDRFRPGA